MLRFSQIFCESIIRNLQIQQQNILFLLNRFHVCRANSYLCFQFQFSRLIYHVSGYRTSWLFSCLRYIYLLSEVRYLCVKFLNNLQINLHRIQDIRCNWAINTEQHANFLNNSLVTGCVIITSNIIRCYATCMLHIYTVNSCKEIFNVIYAMQVRSFFSSD